MQSVVLVVPSSATIHFFLKPHALVFGLFHFFPLSVIRYFPLLSMTYHWSSQGLRHGQLIARFPLLREKRRGEKEKNRTTKTGDMAIEISGIIDVGDDSPVDTVVRVPPLLLLLLLMARIINEQMR